ncbi:RNA polymerase sigma factor [Marinifilum sp.]|uniref:RNA polymerase sigma factor n=1 Tax=Marinifilum sp. TaxID=2033137 RepID=UPI003BAD1D71
MNNISDEEILQLFQDKKTQSQAFSMLVRKYQERLYWQIRKIVLSHDDADDVLQNTFVKIWKGLIKFRYDAKFFTWMYRIATNESLTFLKEKQRRNIAFANKDVEEMLIANLQADEYFDGDQAQIEFQKAILRLPEKQRLVFNMKYFDELKYEEISEVLETSVGALKASYHHAVKKIESFLKLEC